jgi:putative oxidoreductase
MKTSTRVAQFLLGIAFVVFGLNGFLHFIPIPPPDSENGKNFLGLLAKTNYLSVVKALELIGGLFVLSGRLAPLGLVILTPILVNIIIFDAFMDPLGLPVVLILSGLAMFLMVQYKSFFAPFLKVRGETCTFAPESKEK